MNRRSTPKGAKVKDENENCHPDGNLIMDNG